MLSAVLKLGKSKGLRSAFLMTVGNVGSTGIAAVAMIIFSRQLGPEQFGIFSVLFSLMLIISRIGDMGINIAVSRAIAQNQNNKTLNLAFAQNGAFLKAMIMAVVVITGLITTPFITETLLTLTPDFVPMVRAVILLSISVVVYEYVNSLLQARQYFGLSVLTNTVQSSLKLLLALATLVFVGINLSTVTLGYMILPLIGACVGFLAINARELLPIYSPKITKSIINVARWTSISILASAVAENVDVLIVQKYLSVHETGLYAAATRIATVASLIGWSLGTVLNMRVAKYRDKVNLDRYLKKGIMLAIVSLLATAALCLISYPVVTYTIGPAYLSVVPTLNILLISTAFLTATTPFVALFYVFDYPRYFAVSGIITALSLLISDIVLVPTYGLIGAGWARVITRLVVGIYTVYIAYSLYQKTYGKK